MSSFVPKPSTYLSELFVKDFRNLAQAELSLAAGHNLFVGNNGHGKTNCLEAIAMACSLRTIQPLKNSELIRFDSEMAKVRASFDGDLRSMLDIEIHSPGKRVRLNDKPVRNASQITKATPIVSFIPAELNMVSGAAGLRRRAIDQASASLFFEASLSLRAYEKVLAHRNRLLKDRQPDLGLLKTFTDMLIEEGARVISHRLQAIDQLAKLFRLKLQQILGDDLLGEIEYLSSEIPIRCTTSSALIDLLKERGKAVLGDELRRRSTLFGPHLDDVVFSINGVPAKNFSSRGQSRAIVLALKLAQMLAIHQVRRISPIIILDDIVSELDVDKKQNLIGVIERLNSQAFFSATDIATFGTQVERVFHVRGGVIMRLSASSQRINHSNKGCA